VQDQDIGEAEPFPEEGKIAAINPAAARVGDMNKVYGILVLEDE
jgi:hypothetical protein